MDKIVPKENVPFFWGPLDGCSIRLKTTTTEYKIPLPDPGPADFSAQAGEGELTVPKLRCQKYTKKTTVIDGKNVTGMWYVGEEDI